METKQEAPVRHGYVLKVGHQLRCPQCREIQAVHDDAKTFIGQHVCRWCETPFVLTERDL